MPRRTPEQLASIPESERTVLDGAKMGMRDLKWNDSIVVSYKGKGRYPFVSTTIKRRTAFPLGLCDPSTDPMPRSYGGRKKLPDSERKVPLSWIWVKWGTIKELGGAKAVDKIVKNCLNQRVLLILLLLLLTSCISTREYRAYHRGLDDKYNEEQAEAKQSGKKLSFQWGNQHMMPR